MRRFLLVIAFVLIVIAGVAVWWWHRDTSPISIRRSDVVSVSIEPVPEGPASPIFDAKDSNGSRPLRLILADVPVPLPGPGVQPLGCRTGGDLIIALRDGRTITYGPCHHPASIRHLWRKIVMVLSHGRCHQPCAPPE
jgi:hypothetical protein